MGCFSYICKCCGKSVKEGEGVKLWLLQGGKVLEEKKGNYNLYGAVKEEPNWKNDWRTIVDIQFDNSNDDGLAAIHTDCWEKSNKKIPKTQSDDDENQGCGYSKRKSTAESYSKFYSLISNEPFEERDEKFEKLNDELGYLFKKGKELIEKLKEDKNK